MNYILTIPFLLLIFLFYEEVGAFLLKLCNYKEITIAKKVLGGFLFTFFLSFIIGIPCQFLHLPWKIFSILYSIILILFVAIVLKFNRKDMIKRMKDYQAHFMEYTWIAIKENYLIFILVALFVVLSMSNTLPYYQMNYDDSYFIGKIVNLVGSSGLLNENYYNGALYDGFEGGIARLFNTYEITYGYFASLFHISIPFFCRCTMTIHNYLMTFIAYKAVACYFVKKEHAQYVLSPFAIFLISAGFMYRSEQAPFIIRMYDAWQFQTAMFYGGSVVRMTCIPVILLFGKEIFEYLDWKKVLLMAMIYGSYVSFSTVFFPYAVFLTIGFALLKCTDFAFEDHKVIGIAGLLGLLMIIYILSRLDGKAFTLTDQYIENYAQYKEFIMHYFDKDTIYIWMPFLLPIGLIIGKERSTKYLTGTVLIVFLFFYSKKFDPLIMLTTVNYMFVAMRVWASMQYYAVFMLGIGVISLLENMKIHRYFMLGLSLGMISYSILMIKNHIGDIQSENFAGSGMIEKGYDLDQLWMNDEMVPDLFVSLGDYFDALPYGNYRLVINDEIPYNDTFISGYGMVTCSNRIEIYCHGGLNNMVRKQYEELLAYLKNEKPFSEVKYLIDEHEIQYILVTDENQKNELINQGYEVAMESKEINPYWLIKTIYA